MKIALILCTSFAFLGSLVAEEQFHAEIDYLLFQAHQDGFFRATDVFFPAAANGVVIANENDHYIEDNRWNSGVRATLSWEPESRPWNLTLQYSYMGRTIPSKKLESAFNPNINAGNSVLFTDYITNILSIPVTYTNEASWKFSFNQIDLLMEQPFCIGEETTLTPYFGLRGLCIQQKVEMSAVNTVTPFSTETGDAIVHRVYFKPQFDGVGLVGGLEGRFMLGYGFDLCAKMGGGLIWGKFKNDQKDNVAIANSPVILAEETVVHDFWGTSLNANFALGIEWTYPINCGCQWLSVHFGWENHLYTKTNNSQNFAIEQTSLDGILNLDRNVQRGDFSFQGFSLGVACLF